MPRLNSFRELEHLQENLREKQKSITQTVMICGGTGCQSSGSPAVKKALLQELEGA